MRARTDDVHSWVLLVRRFLPEVVPIYDTPLSDLCSFCNGEDLRRNRAVINSKSIDGVHRGLGIGQRWLHSTNLLTNIETNSFSGADTNRGSHIVVTPPPTGVVGLP